MLSPEHASGASQVTGTHRPIPSSSWYSEQSSSVAMPSTSSGVDTSTEFALQSNFLQDELKRPRSSPHLWGTHTSPSLQAFSDSHDTGVHSLFWKDSPGGQIIFLWCRKRLKKRDAEARERLVIKAKTKSSFMILNSNEKTFFWLWYDCFQGNLIFMRGFTSINQLLYLARSRTSFKAVKQSIVRNWYRWHSTGVKRNMTRA